MSPLGVIVAGDVISTKIPPLRDFFPLRRMDIIVEIDIPPPPAPEELHMLGY